MFTRHEGFYSDGHRAGVRTIQNIENTCKYAYDNPVLAAATVAVIGACMIVAIKATIIALLLGVIVLFGINLFKPPSMRESVCSLIPCGG